jgi:hypothetical protein
MRNSYICIGQVKQVYSHFTLMAAVFHQPLAGQKLPKGEWKTLEEISALPLSKADEKVLKMLKNAA